MQAEEPVPIRPGELSQQVGKRTNGVKQEVYGRLGAGVEIDPDILASELGCSPTAVAHNIRNWEREGNKLSRRRNDNGHFTYVPGNDAGSSTVALPAIPGGFIPLPSGRLPAFGQLLQVTGVGMFDSSRVTLMLRDEDGQTWAAEITARTGR